MEDMSRSDTAVDIARVIDDHQGADTLVLDVSGVSSWTDYFVITTAKSTAHLNGLVRYVREFLDSRKIISRHRHKRLSDDGWILIDCGDIVVHLMDRETREFYELERLWFSAKVVYQSSKSS